jgi:cytochrome c oxidase assembly protein subunit 15
MYALINLDPVLELILLGAALALLPVGLVGWRLRRQGQHGPTAWLRVLTVLTLFLTIDLVIFGAFTRLTDSGLGCPDWPGCYGETSPFAAHAQIQAAHQALPTGPVSHGKAWIEMVHRYLATAVGALITLLMVLSWRWRRQAGALSPWWPTLTFVWVCAQGAFGALTVTLKLQPIVVTTHLLGAMLGVGLLTWQVRQTEQRTGPLAWTAAWRGSPLRRAGWAVLALLGIQVALGAWVSTNYAVLACTEWPTCQGSWWPEMDFASAFRLMRPLGGDGQGAYISLAALTAIHVTHRWMAVVVLLALWWYGRALRAWEDAGQRPWHRDGTVLWGLAALQLLTGLSNVVLGWPLAAALLHTLGAALLVWRLVRVVATEPPCASEAKTLASRYQGLHAGEPHMAGS